MVHSGRPRRSEGDGVEDVETAGPAGGQPGGDARRRRRRPASRRRSGRPGPRSRRRTTPGARRRRRAEQQAEPDAERGAERGDQCRLEAHHSTQLTAGHADGPDQAELTGPLEHRQRQGVGDADQGDDDGQGDHHVRPSSAPGRPCRRFAGGTASAVSTEAYGNSSDRPDDERVARRSARRRRRVATPSHSGVGATPASVRTRGVEQVVLRQDRSGRRTVRRSSPRHVNRSANSMGSVSPTLRMIALALSTDTTTGIGDVAVEPAGRDVERRAG